MTEERESPWSDPSPSYRVVPKEDPKTGKEVKLYVCMNCGGAVVSRKIHSRWCRK